MNLAPVLAAAERSAAAYLSEPIEAQGEMQRLGHEWYGLYSKGAVQACLTMKDGAGYVSIAGTRFGAEVGALDLLHDLNVEGLDVGHGACVAQGAFEGLFGLWQWVYSVLPATAPIWVEGHSLGAWRTYYSPLFVPESRLAGLHCFESPKAGNREFWDTYGRSDTIAIVNGGDIFFNYPFATLWNASQPDQDHLWLHAGQLEVIRPADWVGGTSLEDHSLASVIAALCGLMQG